MTDPALLAKIKAGRGSEASPGRSRCDAEAVEELFLATLSRPPTEDEARSALDHLRHEPRPGLGPGGRALGADQHARIHPESLNDHDRRAAACLGHGPTARGSTAATSCGPASPGCWACPCPTCSGPRPAGATAQVREAGDRGDPDLALSGDAGALHRNKLLRLGNRVIQLCYGLITPVLLNKTR